MRLTLHLLVMLVVCAPAHALPFLCSAAKSINDQSMIEARDAIFPRSQARSNAEDCANPLQLLRFGDADVLLTSKGSEKSLPCHGCGAVLSAFVMRRKPEGPKVLAHFLDFTELGSSGNAGLINPIQLGGHDAFCAASGGVFQGYGVTVLSFFVFRDGRLDAIKPDLPLQASNGGAMTDETKAVSIDGAWHIDPARPDAVTVEYLTITNTQRRRDHATWMIKDKTFVLTSGHAPPEYGAASGRE